MRLAFVVALATWTVVACGSDNAPATSSDKCLGKCYTKPHFCWDGSLDLRQCVEDGRGGCEFERIDPCPPQVSCMSAADCKDGEVCDADGCGTAGHCHARLACDSGKPPVCGCDGKTYFNRCLALVAGTRAASEGECLPDVRTACGSTTPCPEGSFCRLPDKLCAVGTLAGYCMKLPSGCPDISAPVCGCDKKSYKNVCLAWAAGQNFSEWANCPAE